MEQKYKINFILRVFSSSAGQEGSVCKNGESLADQGASELETPLNLEVSFSEQALSYREGSKASEAQRDTDDKLPVSAIKH